MLRAAVLLSLSLAIAISGCAAPDAADRSPSVGEIASLASPIPTRDGAWIDPFVRDQRVVLIGEEVHGVAEHIDLKTELALRLVTRHGFTHVLLEDDPFKAVGVDRALRNDPAAIPSAFAPFYWCWNVAQMHRLAEALAGLPAPPTVVGFDVQTAHFALRSLYERATTDSQRDAIGAIETIFGAEAGTATEADAGPLFDAASRAFTPQCLDAEIDHLRLAWRTHLASSSFAESVGVREFGMAQSIVHLLRANPDARVVVLAHNAHAGYEPFYASFVPGGVRPLARILRDDFQIDTLSIGAVFATGAALVDPRARAEVGGPVRTYEQAAPGTQAERWSTIDAERWVLDLAPLRRGGPASELRDYLVTPPPGHFDNFGPATPLLTGFDLLVGYRIVTASTPAR